MFSPLNFQKRIFFTAIGYVLSAIIHGVVIGGGLFLLYYYSNFLILDSHVSKIWVSLSRDSSKKSQNPGVRLSDSSKKTRQKRSSESLVKSKETLESLGEEKISLKKEFLEPGQSLISPKLRGNLTLFYPQEAQEEEMEGDVVLLLRISKFGKVVSAVIKKSSGWKILDGAALKHAQTLEFVPCIQNGNAIESEIEFPFAFRLKNDQSEL